MEGKQLKLFYEDFPVLNKQINYNYNLSFLDASNPSLRTKGTGNFFEVLSQGIFGGKLQELFYFKKERVCADLVNRVSCVSREIKGVNVNNYLNLLDKQIAKNVIFQNAFPEWELRFEIFRHNVEGIIKNPEINSIGSAIKKFPGNINSLLSVPFELIFDIYCLYDKSKFTFRYDREKWNKMTRLNKSGLDLLASNPELAFKHLGLNPKKYSIKEKIFPNDVTFNNFLIKPFQVIFIESEYNNSFNKTLARKVNSRLDSFPEDFSKVIVGASD